MSPWSLKNSKNDTNLRLVCLSVACGLRCYTCTAAEPSSCTDTESCTVIFNRCFSLTIDGLPNVVTKGCLHSVACVGAMSCCEGNLCNTATYASPSVLLLTLSSALITLFL
ncbi:uncharacterized protein FYW47_007727 [Aplochiton taeniatus]